MVQIHDLGPSPGSQYLSQISQNLGMGLSQGIGKALNQMFESKQKKQQGTALANALGKPELGTTFASLGPEMSKILIEQFGAENLAEALRGISGIETPKAAPTESGTIEPTATVGALGAASAEQASQDIDIPARIRKAPPKQQPQLIKAYQEQQKLDLQKKKGIAKQFEPIIKQYSENAMEADKNLPNIKVAITTNEKADTKPGSWDALVDASNNPFLRNFKSQNAQILEAQAPVFIAGFKDKMGGQLTDAKINLIARKTIGVGKDKNVNRLLGYMAYYDANLDKLRDAFSQQIIMDNDGYPPKDYNSQINKKLDPYRKEIDKDLTALLQGKKPTSDLSKGAILATPRKSSSAVVMMRDPAGNLRKVSKNDAKKAEQAGYKIEQ